MKINYYSVKENDDWLTTDEPRYTLSLLDAEIGKGLDKKYGVYKNYSIQFIEEFVPRSQIEDRLNCTQVGTPYISSFVSGCHGHGYELDGKENSSIYDVFKQTMADLSVRKKVEFIKVESTRLCETPLSFLRNTGSEECVVKIKLTVYYRQERF